MGLISSTHKIRVLSVVSIYLTLFIYLFISVSNYSSTDLLFLQLHVLDRLHYDGMDLCNHIIEPNTPEWSFITRPIVQSKRWI